MKRLTILLFTILPYVLLAQEESDKFNVQLSGFFRGDYWYETRQNYGACEELFTLYPKPIQLDDEGNDINSETVSNMVAIASRIRTVVKGPEVLGARSMAYFEVDFTSNLGVDGFRFRHAYLKLEWDKSELLFGRYWHPFFVTSTFPTVIALNTGAPYQTFNRSPQLRFTGKLNNFNFVTALVYQGDYASYGPNGASADYMKNASLPEVNLRLGYMFNDHIIGVGGTYKVLQPRLKTVTNTGYSVSTDEKVEGSAIMGFFNLNFNKLTIKHRTMIGQNVSEHLLFGGYALSQYDQSTGEEDYTPYRHLFAWGNIIYGSKIRFGIFGGYAKNLGTLEQIYTGAHPDNAPGEFNTIYARGSNIDYSYRIAPHFQYTVKNLQLASEIEYTAAAYGDINYDSGEVIKSKKVDNLRLLITATYVF